MEFKHINDVRDAIEKCKTKEELENLIDEIPNVFGVWEIQCNDDGYCIAVNDWYDKICETWEHDEYETEIPYEYDKYLVIDIKDNDVYGEFNNYEDAEQFVDDDQNDHNLEIVRASDYYNEED